VRHADIVLKAPCANGATLLLYDPVDAAVINPTGNVESSSDFTRHLSFKRFFANAPAKH
jgi:hypothetical protein